MKKIILSLRTVFLILFVFVSLNTYTQESKCCNAFGENQWTLVSSHDGVEFYIAYRTFKNPSFEFSSNAKEYYIQIHSKIKNTNNYSVIKTGLKNDYLCDYFVKRIFPIPMHTGQDQSNVKPRVEVEKKNTNIKIADRLEAKETKVASYLIQSDYNILLIGTSVSFNFKKSDK